MKLFNEDIRWKMILGANLLIVASVAWAYCGPPPQMFMMRYAKTDGEKALSQIKSTMNSVDNKLSLQLEDHTRKLVAAIATLTKQKAISANQTADAGRVSGQMTATGLNLVSQNERLKQARLEYGGEFGQGYSPCAVYQGRQTIATQDAALDSERRRRVAVEVLATPGGYGDRAKAQRQMVMGRAEFCTEDQVRTGVCSSKGSHPAADLSVGTLFEPAMEGEALYRAKNLFVNHVVGLPDAAVPATSARSKSAEQYVLSKARKDALISPAINSFKAIQLDYSGVDSAHGASGVPLIVQLRHEVSRYGGDSPEHESWTRKVSQLVERGAMVEILKMLALDLKLQEREYRTWERAEANLAALVAMEIENSGIAARSRGSADKVLKTRMQELIK